MYFFRSRLKGMRFGGIIGVGEYWGRILLVNLLCNISHALRIKGF